MDGDVAMKCFPCHCTSDHTVCTQCCIAFLIVVITLLTNHTQFAPPNPSGWVRRHIYRMNHQRLCGGNATFPFTFNEAPCISAVARIENHSRIWERVNFWALFMWLPIKSKSLGELTPRGMQWTTQPSKHYCWSHLSNCHVNYKGLPPLHNIEVQRWINCNQSVHLHDARNNRTIVLVRLKLFF